MVSGVEIAVNRLALSDDGRWLAASPNLRRGRQSWVNVWDLATGKISADKARIQHSNFVTGISFGPFNRRLASAGADGTVQVHDIDNWRLVRSISTGMPPQKGKLLRHQRGPFFCSRSLTRELELRRYGIPKLASRRLAFTMRVYWMQR